MSKNKLPQIYTLRCFFSSSNLLFLWHLLFLWLNDSSFFFIPLTLLYFFSIFSPLCDVAVRQTQYRSKISWNCFLRETLTQHSIIILRGWVIWINNNFRIKLFSNPIKPEIRWKYFYTKFLVEKLICCLLSCRRERNEKIILEVYWNSVE